jgi:hypothetical protein
LEESDALQAGTSFRSTEQGMARTLLIYALRDDALTLLQSLESGGAFQYVLTGAFDSRDTPVYDAAADIPDLGTTDIADKTSSNRYMVFRPAVKVVRRKVPQNGGGALYFVDPWKNPPCIMFTSAGLFERQRSRCVISGEIVTGYTDGPALSLFRQFEREAKKQFTRVKAPCGNVYIGTNAMQLLKDGVRFTDTLGTEPDMDVTYQHVCAAHPNKADK